MSSSTTDTHLRALTCAVRSAEKLSRDCTSGMLRATSTVAQKETAATQLADVLRAVLLVADVQGISLERCVQQRLREMMLEYPLPESMLQHPEPHSDAFGSSDHTTSTDNATSQFFLPTPLPLVVADAVGSARRTHIDSLGPVEGRPPMVRSSSSNSKLVGSATTKGPDDFPTASASAASETGGAHSQNSRLRLSSSAPTTGTDGVQPSAASANGPQSSMSSMHVFPSSSGSTLHRQVKDVLPASSAKTPPAATASSGQPHHMSHPAVAEYIDSVLYADESSGFANVSVVLCSKQQLTPETLDSPQNLLDTVDPVHAEYLSNLMVNPSFVGTVSPMTPADIQRQSLCDMIPSASWTSMKRSYHEGLSRSQQLRRGGEYSTGPSSTLVAVADSATTALPHDHAGSPSEHHRSHHVATVLHVEQPPVITFGFADSKSHSALSTQTNTRQTTPQAAASEMQVHNSSSLTRSFSSAAHEGGPFALDVKAVLSDGSDPLDNGSSPTVVGNTQVLFPSQPRVSPKAASKEPPVGRIIRRKQHTVSLGLHAAAPSPASPVLPAQASPSRPATGPRLYFGLELLRQARDTQ